MTREQIAAGLEELALGLANGLDTTETPAGFAPHEWAYILGAASGAILRLRDRLLPPAPTPLVGWGDTREKS